MELLGRTGERERVGRLLAGAREGRSAALLVHGEAGIGKSALLADAERQAAGFRVLVLRARGYETEADIPFAGLQDLLGPVVGLRERIPEVQARALGGALALEPPVQAGRFAVPAALLSLLAAAAEDRPVLAIVDDVHWLDVPTREALAFAARRLDSEGVVVLLAARSGEGVEQELQGIEQLELGPLDEATSTELVGHAGHGPVADAVTRRLVDTAAGNPLALLELPGVLTADQRSGREPLAWPLPPTPTIERAFAERVECLDPGVRQALLLAAAMETGRLDVLYAGLLHLGLDPALLAQAERAGLVTVGTRLEFRHPVVRSTVYHRAADPERRRVHLALADVAPDERRRAWHAAIAAHAPDEPIAAALEAAARDARARGGQSVAAHAFQRAAQLTPDPGTRARRRLEAAADFAGAGCPEQSLATLDAAEAAGVDDPLLLADLRRIRGRVEMRRAMPRAALALLLPEAERVRELDPGRAARLLVEASVAYTMVGHWEGILRVGERARALAADGVDPIAELLASVMVGAAHATMGSEEEAGALLDEVAPALLDSGHALLSAPAELTALLGHSAIWLERWDRAGEVLGAMVALARGASAVWHLIYPLAAHAHLDLRRGRWTSALADADESYRLAKVTGNNGLLAFSAATLALVEASLGRGELAQEHAKESLALTESHGVTVTSVYALHALGLEALARGDAELAGEWLDRAQRVAGAVRYNRGAVPFGADRVEAHARAGRADAAHVALEELADAAGGGRWAQAVLARCRGILAAGGEYEDHFEAALAHHEHDGQPWERGRTLLAYGERLRRDRRRADAREMLVDALATFDRLGSAPWAERARIELRATGQSTPAGVVADTGPAEPSAEDLEAAGLEELTPHELQIARLVAYGMTNREVAAKLFLSPKTIEYHLSAIYRKLDLRSRTQLAKLLASELPQLAARQAVPA